MSFRTLFLRTLVVVLALILGGISGIVADRALLPNLAANTFFARWSFFKKATENTVIINKTEQITVSEDDSIEKIALQAAPSVVNILSVGKPNTEVQKVGEQNLAKNPDALQGSGVLVTNDGLVATYRTAILMENANYTVFLYNGTSYSATLAGIDPLTNIAFLKIDANNVPAIAFANSDDTRPGRRIILIANTSEEYRNQYSTGVIGNIDKTFNVAGGTVASSEKWEGVFRVDAANTAPYLGGPVIGYNGELVGIVGNAPSDAGFDLFLLPSNAVRTALERKIRNSLDAQPTLGVSYLSITKIYAASHNIGRDRGALIYTPSGKQGLAILLGSPAEKAGLKIGDIIIAVNGQEINLDFPLSVAISKFRKGDTLILRVLRSGSERDISVSL